MLDQYKHLYLAAPYTSKKTNPQDAHDEEWLRFQQVNILAGLLMRDGHAVFSPLSHSVPIHDAAGSTFDYLSLRPGGLIKFWVDDQDLSFIVRWADALVVVASKGWDKSTGVHKEISAALVKGIPVFIWSGYDRPKKDWVFRTYGG